MRPFSTWFILYWKIDTLSAFLFFILLYQAPITLFCPSFLDSVIDFQSSDSPYYRHLYLSLHFFGAFSIFFLYFRFSLTFFYPFLCHLFYQIPFSVTSYSNFLFSITLLPLTSLQSSMHFSLFSSYFSLFLLPKSSLLFSWFFIGALHFTCHS